jgi:NADH:ubiquinone oxidoreductase subunit K
MAETMAAGEQAVAVALVMGKRRRLGKMQAQRSGRRR